MTPPRSRILPALALLVVFWTLGASPALAIPADRAGCAANPSLTANLKLTIEHPFGPGYNYLSATGSAFAVGGQKKFLTLFSYFGAAQQTAAEAGPIFDYLCAHGFNGVRIFAEYWYSPDYCSGGHVPLAQALIKPGTAFATRPPNGSSLWVNAARLENLKSILRRARQAGLVVDLTFGYEVVLNRIPIDQRDGLTYVAGQLASSEFDHVMFDVQNEFKNAGCGRTITDSELGDLMAAAKTGSATRIVFASVAAPANWQNLDGVVQQFGKGGMVFASHDYRYYADANNDGAWYSTGMWTWQYWESVVANFVFGARIPMYAQEPDRWMRAASPTYPTYPACGPNVNSGTTDNACELTSAQLAGSAKIAMQRGLAAWTFHTEALFFPGHDNVASPTNPPERFRGFYPNGAGMGLPELEVLGVSAGPGSLSLLNAISTGCWGVVSDSVWTWLNPMYTTNTCS